MFRNPRTQAATETVVGRPPTPPLTRSDSAKIQTSSPYFAASDTPTPPPIRMLGSKKKPFANGNNKAKPNASILNFFSKATDTSSVHGDNADELFFRERGGDTNALEPTPGKERSISPSKVFLDGGVNLGDDDLFENEESPLKKKRKIELSPGHLSSLGRQACTSPPPELFRSANGVDESFRHDSESEPNFREHTRPGVRRTIGGFIDESESEDEMQPQPMPQEADKLENNDLHDQIDPGVVSTARPFAFETPPLVESLADDSEYQMNPSEKAGGQSLSRPPALQTETTSIFDPDDFDEMDDFEDEEFYEQGEEYLERRWMQEQQELEMGLDDDDVQDIEPTTSERDQKGKATIQLQEDSVSECPICGGNLKGISDLEASQHVNSCLDGKPTTLSKPLAETSKPKVLPMKREMSPGPASKRFQRAAIARPPQENPFSFSTDKKGSSAFSKLMSGHAEDAAWAVAAANEAKSRGRPAWERTCPFYKILPGFFICVDGFRYGKVEGCTAYFLSHFHSDHYIGLTSNWSHGPIYCSRVTANLVRQQLKVDPKWVRALEWEQTTEVPETKGVFVTMIPANHCPGSSLYLFEKTVGRGLNPRKQRVLHCGDFRACPAHVNHPLLKPEALEAVSGKTKQQMIDVCYLDTTYLTPKYAFPSQEDVIASCAEMCVSMSKEIVDAGDAWETMKRERAGSGMVKFLGKEPKAEEEDAMIKLESTDEGEDIKPNLRGRLLVVIGTYSIGKERICLGIARALKSKIYAPPSKQRICAALEDPELSSLLTSNPLEAQIHMQMLMEIRAETLAEYLQSYKPHFSRVVGFRPTGWNYRPPTSRFTENPAVSTVLNSDGWKSRFAMRDLVPQRGSTKESNCFGVPYSEHSSFRELTMFCCALRIGKVIPTVNVGSKKSRERMKMWVEKWEAEKKKNGLYRIEEGATTW